jgi:hypothetical protein
MTPPRYDPTELEAMGLTEEEAEDIRQGMEEVDRGETVPLKESFDQIIAELEELTRVRERRTG